MGDKLEYWLRVYGNSVYRAALALLADRAEAEDVSQEVFLRAWQKAPEFCGPEHEKAWLLRVTINLCRSRQRSLLRKKTCPLLDSYPAREPTQALLIETVERLPVKYRTVIHLFYYEGYAVAEIAGLTGQKEATVRSLLTRARRKLGALLKEENDETL